MTSVRNLQFSESMTATSINSTTNKQITEEKQFSRRTSIHKHLMTVMAVIHISISQQTLLQIFFRFYLIKLNDSKDVMTCSLVNPLIYTLYQIMNLVFLMLFLKFVMKKKEYYTEGIEKDYSKQTIFVKICFIIPQSMILLKYGSRYYCDNIPFSRNMIGKEDFIFQHQVLEQVFQRFYLNWFVCEIVNLLSEDNFSSGPSSLRKTEPSSKKKTQLSSNKKTRTQPNSLRKVVQGSIKKVCEVNN